VIVPPDPRYAFHGQYIVFIALPEEDGDAGLVTYALGPFEDWKTAELAARAARRQCPDAFVRWSPLRAPGPGEAPLREIVDNAPEP
jgi:hypothetical protein